MVMVVSESRIVRREFDLSAHMAQIVIESLRQDLRHSVLASLEMNPEKVGDLGGSKILVSIPSWWYHHAKTRIVLRRGGAWPIEGHTEHPSTDHEDKNLVGRVDSGELKTYSSDP